MAAASEKDMMGRIRSFLHLDACSPLVRRIVVGVVGGAVLLIGLAMIFLPGPAFIMIPVGLAVLASEFSWARRWLDRTRAYFKEQRRKWKARRQKKA